MPREQRDRLCIPSVELVMQRSGHEDSNEVGGDHGEYDSCVCTVTRVRCVQIYNTTSVQTHLLMKDFLVCGSVSKPTQYPSFQLEST